ncbi:MAG: hypothetical protein V7636_1063, partial [Actinomycetota bacterium]
MHLARTRRTAALAAFSAAGILVTGGGGLSPQR